jgi:hypothetical protein
MLKWNEAATEAASKNEEVRSERNRRQDDDFCRALRAALFARKANPSVEPLPDAALGEMVFEWCWIWPSSPVRSASRRVRVRPAPRLRVPSAKIQLTASRARRVMAECIDRNPV